MTTWLQQSQFNINEDRAPVPQLQGPGIGNQVTRPGWSVLDTSI